MSNWRRALVPATTGLGVALAVAGPASAQPVSAVPLRQSGVIATDVGPSDCAPFPPGDRAATEEGWLFQAPAGSGFRAVRLRFTVPSGGVVDLAVTGPAPAGAGWHARWLDRDRRLALTTGAGWTLTSGTADVTGSPEADFDLVATCWRDPLPAALPGGALLSTVDTPGPAARIPVAARVTASPTGPATPRPTPGSGLPVTGTRLGPLLLSGLVLTGAGTLLRAAVRRRRRSR